MKTLSSLQQESVTEHLERIVSKVLSDPSDNVRRAAVFACLKLHHMSPTAVKETDLIDTLYGMIRDKDPTVVINCLSALDEILSDEGGVVINRAIAHHLLSRLESFPTWSQIQVLDVLKKYTPGNDDEVFDIMNKTDRCLTSNCSALVASCLQLFLHLLQGLPHLKPEVFKRSQATLVSHLAGHNAEVIFPIIDIISSAPKEALSHFCTNVQSFFCHNKDPLYLKLKKIQLLPWLITEENGEAILEELGLYCVNSSEDVSFHAVQAIGLLYQQVPYLADSCLAKLSSLTQSSSPHVLSNLLQILQNMRIDDKNFWEKLLSPVCNNHHSVCDSQGQAALLYLIGEYLCDSAEAYAVIEECVEDFADLQDRDVKEQLLTAAVKMLLAHPYELQSLVGGLFEVAVEDSDYEVKSRAEFLYLVLESGTDIAKSVLLHASAQS